MTQALKKYYTPEEYLALEEIADYKSEYFDGEIFAMTGASRNHNVITLNVGSLLRQAFKGRKCIAFTNDMKVQARKDGPYVYPDVIALCGELSYAKNRTDMITNPTIVIEVLSESTEAYDRGLKFRLYRTIPSLQEYVLIDQREMVVECYHKDEQGRWVLEQTLSNQDETLKLAAIGVELPLSEIYDKVEFENITNESPTKADE